MSTKKGVFVHFDENPDVIIQACKNLIESSIAEGKIEAAIPVDKYGGIKLYLNRDDVVQKFLSRRFLLKENGEKIATIHPLTTQLIVREGKFLMEKEEFLEELKDFILDNIDIKDRQILEISHIPFLENHPDILTTNLRVILDVPEIEELYVFKDSCFPKDLQIPIGTENEMPSLNFYCPGCKKVGILVGVALKALAVKQLSILLQKNLQMLKLLTRLSPEILYQVTKKKSRKK